MKYQALYRKYRPKNFDQISGQETVVKILKNAISNKKIPHAYLFYGPRGTGKTSIAKLFARTINCEENGTIPCEKCNSCIVSSEKECVDIIEIDAASNNGVDEIRDLRSKVSFVPTELKYKVYIIDEVHMLSIGAFNALLKTLEEPPGHVIFILATTEFNKVPNTIVSRCQTLEFKKINDNDMLKKMEEICKNENIKYTVDSLKEIIKNSNGGLRDAIGLLEKAYSYIDENETITSEIIRKVSGNISVEEMNQFIMLFDNKNVEKIIAKINDYYNDGYDIVKIIGELLEYKKNNIIDSNDYNYNDIRLVNQLNDMYEQLKKSDNQRILSEILILNILFDNNIDVKNKNTLNSDEKKEKVSDSSEVKSNLDVNVNNNSNNISELKKIRIGNTLYAPQKNIISNIRSRWDDIKELAFDSKYGNIVRLISSDINPVAASDTNIILVAKLNGLADQINSNINDVEIIFNRIFHRNFKPICLSEQEWFKCIEEFKKDKNIFSYQEEKNDINVKDGTKKTLREKAKELFED